jgi:uncharacterized protein YciI
VSTVPPIRREILVDADPDAAFEVFTAGLGQWWPVDEKSVHGKGATVAFDDGQIVERPVDDGADDGADGEPVVWGTVTRWESFADPAAARAEYDQGWPVVLGCYQAHLGEAGETWVALLRRPGPAAPRTGSLFEDPRFAQHVAFLNRMREDGYLVLAGPLGDAAGEGMTILRLPGPGRLTEATRLATEDDASVAGGFLAVTVRPWQVMMVAG